MNMNKSGEMANLGEWHFGIQMKEPKKRRKANSIEK
jgi:hypothetical protein